MWPTPQDYNEAVQNPALCFADPELRKSLPELNALGLPKPMSGTFASVYQMHGNGAQWAVRFFLQNFRDQSERYLRMTAFLAQQPPAYTVGFQFLESGVQIHGAWYPILKMDWVSGDTLIEWIQRNLHNPRALEVLRIAFLKMCDYLGQTGIAHGDLQHGNIMVVGNYLKLVDYDGMYVPALAGFGSHELGHRHYQHPGRSKEHFGPYLDNFAAWSIHTSLQCLALDPSLWQTLGGGDECLLFRHEDYVQPLNSVAFRLLENHQNTEIRDAARTFRFVLNHPPHVIPRLGEPLIGVDSLPKLEPPVLLPDWMQPIAHGTSGISDGPTPLYFGATTKFRDPEQHLQNLRTQNRTALAEAGNTPRLVAAPPDSSGPPPLTSSQNSMPPHLQGAYQNNNSMPGQAYGGVPGHGSGSMQGQAYGSAQSNSPKLTTPQYPTVSSPTKNQNYIRQIYNFLHPNYQTPHNPAFPWRLSRKTSVMLAGMTTIFFVSVVASILIFAHVRHAHFVTHLPGVVEMAPSSGNQFAYDKYLSAKNLFEQGNYTEPIRRRHEAFDSYSNNNSTTSPKNNNAAICAFKMGQCYLKLEENQSAIYWLQQANDIFDANGRPVANAISNLAFARARLGDFQKAAELYQRELELARGAQITSAGEEAAQGLENMGFELLKEKKPIGITYLSEAVHYWTFDDPDQAAIRRTVVRLQTLATTLEKAKDLKFAAQLRDQALVFTQVVTTPEGRTLALECLQGLKRNALLQHNTTLADGYTKSIKNIEDENGRAAEAAAGAGPGGTISTPLTTIAPRTTTPAITTTPTATHRTRGSLTTTPATTPATAPETADPAPVGAPNLTPHKFDRGRERM